jgi:hypothetical protein
MCPHALKSYSDKTGEFVPQVVRQLRDSEHQFILGCKRRLDTKVPRLVVMVSILDPLSRGRFGVQSYCALQYDQAGSGRSSYLEQVYLGSYLHRQ